jgi:hypothetical protein
LSDAVVNDSRGTREEAAEVYVAASGVHHDVADFGFISGSAIEQTQTAVDGEVWQDLVGGTELETEVIATALHIAVHIVTRGAEGLQLVGYVSDDALERAETVGKLTLATASRYGNVELNAPVPLVIGTLQRRDERCVGHTLESLCCLSVILATESEDGILTLDGTRLVGILPVEGNVESFGQEGDTCGVGINSVESDGRIPGRITEEINTLIRVG